VNEGLGVRNKACPLFRFPFSFSDHIAVRPSHQPLPFDSTRLAPSYRHPTKAPTIMPESDYASSLALLEIIKCLPDNMLPFWTWEDGMRTQFCVIAEIRVVALNSSVDLRDRLFPCLQEGERWLDQMSVKVSHFDTCHSPAPNMKPRTSARTFRHLS
jgi:hypothetical protein